MSKRPKSTGVKSCTCDRCGIELISVPGKRHRRCGGKEGAPIRAKHSPTVGRTLGVWR
jgi:hypothetical protein